jgi:energy-coupling factor transporter ATP-binding protein EcfA2
MAIKKKKSTNTSESNNDSLLDSLGDLFEDSYSEVNYFPSGLLMFDSHNGCVILDENNNFSKADFGIKTGSIVHLISYSGVGKSSLAYSLAGGIIEPFEKGSMIIFDTERACTLNRAKKLSNILNLNERGSKGKLINTGTSSEKLLTLIKAISAKKLANIEDFKEKHPSTGEDIVSPTVIVLDSLPMLLPTKFEEEDDFNSNMAGSQIAIVNNKLVKQTMDDRLKANIIIIVINHITTKINTGNVPVKNNIAGLKPDESVGGGSAWRYLTDYYIRLNLVKEFNENDPEKFMGSEVEFQIIKSRTFPSGKKFKMVFNKVEGWSNNFSNFNFLLEQGYVKLSGAYYSLEDYPNKFFKSNLENLMEKDDFRNIFEDKLQKAIFNYLPKFRSNELVSLDSNSNNTEDFDESES